LEILSPPEPVQVEINQRFEGDKLVVVFDVANAGNLLGYQFAVNYDPSVLAYVSHIDLISAGNPATTGNDEIGGVLSFVSLVNQPDTPFFIPDGETLLTITFDVLKEENTMISFWSESIETMFINENMEERCVNAPAKEILITGSGVIGNIYDDLNQDCSQDNSDLNVSDWIIELVENTSGETFYGYSAEDGSYLVYAYPGSYTVSAYSPNNLWSFCENDFIINLPNDKDKVSQDFYAQADILCPDMVVDVGVGILRRCFDNTYVVEYCNHGTEEAQNVYIEIELDDNLTFLDSSHPDFTLNGNLLTFNIGTVPYGDCGTFRYEVNLECNGTTIGQAHCTSATIYPNVSCDQISPAWSGASLVIEGKCEGDKTNFSIRNVGVGDMLDPLEFIVIEDDVMKPGGSVLLGANQTHAIDPLPADGKTYRVSVPQVPFHPGVSMPSLAIEGCGENETGTISTGFVNMFPHDDGDSHTDIDCTQNRGAFDPNDKAVTPRGYTDKNYLEANTDLSYHIRFQNTGTDTAFRVIITDEIDENLDLSSLVLGASSHEYDLQVRYGRTLEFTFNNIMLVDSVANEPESHGFIKYKIKQKPNLADGVQLKNEAAIYFDFNEPVITNLTQVEIGRETISHIPNGLDIEVRIFPNPTADFINISHSYKAGPVTFELYDQLGRKVKEGIIDNTQSKVSIQGLPEGLYNYKLRHRQLPLAEGKITKM